MSSKGMVSVMMTAGVVMFALGALWIGQGAGFIRWPASSTMIGQGQWIINGLALVAVGAVLAWHAHNSEDSEDDKA